MNDVPEHVACIEKRKALWSDSPQVYKDIQRLEIFLVVNYLEEDEELLCAIARILSELERLKEETKKEK